MSLENVIDSFDVLNFMVFLKRKINSIEKKEKIHLENLLYSKKILNFYLRSILEEIAHLQKEGSSVGEIIQIQGEKVLIKINQDGNYFVNVHHKIKKTKPYTPGIMKVTVQLELPWR